jgi:hypothetical protein
MSNALHCFPPDFIDFTSRSADDATDLLIWYRQLVNDWLLLLLLLLRRWAVY